MKVFRYFAALSLVFFAGSCFAFSQDSEVVAKTKDSKLVLSVSDAIDLALEKNLSLKESKITLDAAKREKNYSWNGLSPSLNAKGSLSGPVSDAASGSDTASASVSASVSLGLSPSIYTSVRAAAINYEQAQITYENAVRTIELNVRKAYCSILYEIENVKLQEQNVESAKNQYESNLEKYNRGTLSRLDVLSTQVTYQNSALTLENLKVSLENDFASFKQTLGIPLDTEIELTGDFNFVRDIKEISIKNFEVKSSTLASLEKQLEAAQNSLLASRFSAWGPSISAGYSYSYGGLLSNTESMEGSGSYSLGVSIPLDGYLPWSSGAQSIANCKDTIEKLQLEIENEKTSLDLSVKNYLNKIKQYQDSINLRLESINLAQQTYDMTQEAYNYGTKDLLSLQSASDNLLSAKLNLMSEEYNLLCAVLELENTLGLPFGTLVNPENAQSQVKNSAE